MMIDVTNVNMVELVKKAYDLSRPQGMGMLHFNVMSELNIAVAPFADTRANAKILRINFMKKYWRTKTIQVMKDCGIKNQLKIEYLSYNQEDSTASRKDDALDALSMLVQNLNKYLDMRHLASTLVRLSTKSKAYTIWQE